MAGTVSLRCAVPKLHQEARIHGTATHCGRAMVTPPCSAQGGVFCCASCRVCNRRTSLSRPHVAIEREVSAWTLVVVVATAHTNTYRIILARLPGVRMRTPAARRGQAPPPSRTSSFRRADWRKDSQNAPIVTGMWRGSALRLLYLVERPAFLLMLACVHASPGSRAYVRRHMSRPHFICAPGS